MIKLGVFYTCYNEKNAVEYSIEQLNNIYPNIPIYLVSEGYDFSYINEKYNISVNVEEDTMSDTFKLTSTNYIEPTHQLIIKKAMLAVLNRLKKAIDYCSSEYILMCDPDTLVRGVLNIPDGVKLLGSRVNHNIPIELRNVIVKYGGIDINTWGATPAIFETDSFLKAYENVINNEELINDLCGSFYAMYAHDMLLPVLYSFIGYEETFNPDIIECNRNGNWEHMQNPLVHQFKRYY